MNSGHQKARRAILAAADHIEKNPKLFKASAGLPSHAGDRGSAQGWIGYFGGYRAPLRAAAGVDFVVLGYDNANQFHYGMCDVNDAMGWRRWFFCWTSNAKMAAKCLRRYADLHHPAAAEQAELMAAVSAPRLLKT